MTHTKVIHLSHHLRPTESVCKDPAFCLMFLFSSYFDVYERQRERWLIAESHSQVVEYYHFALVVHLLKALVEGLSQ